MLIAHDENGARLIASRALPARRTYTCPSCGAGVVLKPGRVKIPHFAHAPGSDCPASGEGVLHLMAKKALAEEFQAAGYEVAAEDAYPSHARRVDLAVSVPWWRTTPSGEPVAGKLSVEVQDSPISRETMYRRETIDTTYLGFESLTWIFIGSRAKPLLEAEVGEEVRCSKDVLTISRPSFPVLCFDVEQHRLWSVELYPIRRSGGLYRDRYPKTVRTVARKEIVDFSIFGSAPEREKRVFPAWSVGDDQRLQLAKALLDWRLMDDAEREVSENSRVFAWYDVERFAADVLEIELGEHQQLWIRNTLLSLVQGHHFEGFTGTRFPLGNPRSPLALHIGCTRLVASGGVPAGGRFALGHEPCPVGGPPWTGYGVAPEGWPPPDSVDPRHR